MHFDHFLMIFENWKITEFRIFKIGKLQIFGFLKLGNYRISGFKNWKIAEFRILKIGKLQNFEFRKLENYRIPDFENW